MNTDGTLKCYPRTIGHNNGEILTTGITKEEPKGKTAKMERKRKMRIRLQVMLYLCSHVCKKKIELGLGKKRPNAIP